MKYVSSFRNILISVLKAFRQEFRLANAYAKYAPTLLQYNYVAKNLSEITAKVFDFYLGKKGFTDLKDFSIFGDVCLTQSHMKMSLN